MEQKYKTLQQQKQRFSNKMVPSIRILQLGHAELESFIDASMIENPFSDIEGNEPIIQTDEIDLNYKTIRKKQDDLQEFDIAADDKNDLIEHVMPQLSPHIKSSRDEYIFRVILESLDTRGFLAEKKEDLCKYLNIKLEKLQGYLQILYHVDPKGLATDNFTHCIQVQLEDKGCNLAICMIKDHLQEISVGNFSKIARVEGTTVEKVREALQLIQLLNPIPANGFKLVSKTIYIIPDIYVQIKEGDVSISMNNSLEDKVKFNLKNYELYKSASFDKSAKEFLKNKLNDFRLLQYSISRRNITLKKIATFLVQYQIEYFRTGDAKCLRPLRLSDVAQALNLHDSTVSRAISNKFFQCEHGTFSLHYLIPRCYKKDGEDMISIDVIKEELKELIKLEDKSNPYSDEQIHQILMEEGYTLSRRSVSLYRKECGIPSSRNRKIQDRKG